MMVEKNKTKQEIWLPAKFVKSQTIGKLQKWVVIIGKQKILMPFDCLQYDESSKGYIGLIPANIILPGIKSLPSQVNSNLLIAIFPKKKRPKEVKHV